MHIPPPNETVVSSLNRLLKSLEQMERFFGRTAAEEAADGIRPWAIANQVCDRYRIPKTA